MPRMGTFHPSQIKRNLVPYADNMIDLGTSSKYFRDLFLKGLLNYSLQTEAGKFIWKDASERVLSDLDRTASKTWTGLDLSASTSSRAKAVLIRLEQGVDVVGTGWGTNLQVRKAGTTPTYVPAIAHYLNVCATGHHLFDVIILGLSSTQGIEYAITVSAGWQVDSRLDVLGYFE